MHDRCVGIVVEGGGKTSHGAIIARQRDIPAVVAKEAAGISPGDQIVIDGSSGVVDVNGGSGEVDRMAPGEEASMGVLRFVWSVGNRRTAPIPQDDPESGVLHTDMIMEMDEAGELDYEDMALGVIYADGHADIVIEGTVSDMDALYAFLRENGATGEISEIGDMMALAKVAAAADSPKPERPSFDAEAADTTGRHFLESGDLIDERYARDAEAVVCPKCGSHTIRAVGDEGDITCLTCGNDFKREILKNPEASMQKGSPYPENSDKNAPDHSPKNQSWPKKVNSIYNACMREADSKSDEQQEKCAKIAWAQYKKMKKGAEETEDDGADMPDWFPAQLQMQLELELADDTKESKVAVAADSNGNELQPGKWYWMHSVNYKVPDVIQVLNLGENRIEAAIDGDEKALFPLVIETSDIEKNGYSFEPYEEYEAPEIKSGNWKVARRNFTATQQRELVNENLGARARNYDKLDLEGTHYPRGESVDRDALDNYFLW
jgi:hypothetical protein